MTHSLNLPSIFASRMEKMLAEDGYKLHDFETGNEDNDEYGNDIYNFLVYIEGAEDIGEAHATARFKVDPDGVITGDMDYNI